MFGVVRTLVGGFLMGAADLVPGVSGGTIALVIGIYERLVASIREGSSALASLIRGRPSKVTEHLKQVEWVFLVPLLAGILLAVVSLASILDHQLEANPTIMAGGFFGLVVGSVLIAWALIRQPLWRHFVIALAVAAALFLILGIGEDATISDPSLFVFLGAGALAICAMILPGISGSLILLVVGMYAAVLDAVNVRDLAAVGVFVLGAIVGLAVFSQILHWALRHHHDDVLAALVGLMAGSLRVLWPWPAGVDSSALGAPDGDFLVVALVAMVGFGFVFLISRLAADQENVSLRQPTG